MPKLKTKSGAKKRFGRTATGKVVRNWGHKRHRLISKAKQQKRLHRGTTTLGKGDAKLVLTYMPYLRGMNRGQGQTRGHGACPAQKGARARSEEHTSELQSR